MADEEEEGKEVDEVLIMRRQYLQDVFGSVEQVEQFLSHVRKIDVLGQGA